MRTGLKAILGSAVLGLSGASVIAAPVTFFGRDMSNDDLVRLAAFPNSTVQWNAFTSALLDVRVESFESAGTNTTNPTMTFGGGSPVTATTTGAIVRECAPGATNGEGRYPISGNKYIEGEGANLVMNFSQPINAFGFWGVDVGDFGGMLTVTTTMGLNMSWTIPNLPGSGGGVNSGSVFFWGLIDPTQSFTRVTFSNSNPPPPGTIDIGDKFAFDDVAFGSVPLPTAWALGAAGLAAIVAGRRRTRR